MATHLRPGVLRVATALLIAVVAGIGGWFGYQRYAERYAVTTEPDTGEAVTRIVTARLSGASSLKVATLSGTLQARATDTRGFGLLKSDQVVKMPYAVDYFVDVSRIGPGDISWSAQNRTLVIDAPDVTVAPPNIDEAARTLVRTQGLYVSREASEALFQRTSAAAQAKAQGEARSPERLAQAREKARAALATLLGSPLAAMGYGDARVLVTFPAERGGRGGERWDVSADPADVLANRR
ncbi:DUF4230 domain-containing protein [Sphingomonas sp. VNH70]|uniref:DUF4230 domain-containing protein n=1 Tax=Sphingomonas silueang TaxID=3156617 RepID=UPI0032B603B1